MAKGDTRIHHWTGSVLILIMTWCMFVSKLTVIADPSNETFDYKSVYVQVIKGVVLNRWQSINGHNNYPVDWCTFGSPCFNVDVSMSWKCGFFLFFYETCTTCHVWHTLQKQFMTSKWKFCDNSFYWSHESNASFWLQICACHDSSLVMTCTKLSTDVMILHIRSIQFFLQNLNYQLINHV